MSRYAVYLIIVEDTEESDMAVMSGPMETGERVAGDLSMDEATDILGDVRRDHGNTLIARED